MIHAITLENFLAHKHTEVRLGPGMNVLTGPNNCGKSAVVEGLRCLVTNPQPRNFIRHGAKEARVTVEVDGGAKITWIRRKASVSYEILQPEDSEPQEFHKLRRGDVPDEVRELLRLDPVELESGREKRVDVHISTQKKPIFLLDDDSADARMAEFFAASTESAHLLAMQKLLKNRAKEAKTEERTVLRQMAGREAELDRLAALPALEMRLEEARTSEETLDRHSRALPHLEQMLARLHGLERAMEAGRVRLAALGPLAPPPELEDAAGPGALLSAITRTGSGLARAEANCAALASLAPPPEPHDTAGLSHQIRSIVQSRKYHEVSALRSGALANLQEPPTPHDESPLVGLLGEMHALTRRSVAAAAEVGACEERLAEHEARLARRMKEMGNCPLCGAALAAEGEHSGESA